MGDNPSKDVVLFDTILFSIAGWYAHYDKSEIKILCCSVFTKADMKTDMWVISDTDKLEGVRLATHHNKTELCFDSMWNNMEYLDQAGHMPIFAVKSSDMKILPMATPVEQMGFLTDA